jgi:hypothetical protein
MSRVLLNSHNEKALFVNFLNKSLHYMLRNPNFDFHNFMQATNNIVRFMEKSIIPCCSKTIF